MLTIVATLTFFSSFVGILIFVYRKIPVLLTLSPPKKKEKFIFSLKKIIFRLNPFKNFSLDIFLQKILVKTRILSLKIDHKTFDLLRRIREKNKKMKERPEDDYWEKIKKEIKK